MMPQVILRVASNSKNNSMDKPSNSSSSDDDAYYASLKKANDDFWNNMSPEDKAKWIQNEEAESRANDPYQNGFISGGGSQTQPSRAGTTGNSNQ